MYELNKVVEWVPDKTFAYTARVEHGLAVSIHPQGKLWYYEGDENYSGGTDVTIVCPKGCRQCWIVQWGESYKGNFTFTPVSGPYPTLKAARAVHRMLRGTNEADY